MIESKELHSQSNHAQPVGLATSEPKVWSAPTIRVVDASFAQNTGIHNPYDGGSPMENSFTS